RLPPAFAKLTSLLERMPIRTATGQQGLLASFTLGEAVLNELPDLTDAIEEVKHDLRVMGALYRDYCFLASAYLLEPCHERYVKGEGYGLGRQRLPAVLAKPLARVAEISGFKPFMEYAGSYALFNWRLEDPKLGMEYENLRLIRAFENGLDPSSSEAGFVLVHVEMVKHSGKLVEGAISALSACGNADRKAFNNGLETIVKAMLDVNGVMDGMWKKSKPNDYNSFRIFIFGITKQSMFPHGVAYEGVSEEPMSFRGESGANDSMIPLCDNLLEISMPETPLTDILQDFRSYRPGNHREFLEWVRDRAQYVGVRDYAMQDRESAVLYLHALNQVRDFRWRHWCFTREYILKKTAHPTATGGSPIVMLFSVYDQMIDVEKGHPELPGCKDIMDLVYSQSETLRKEVDKFCAERS
ncbi:indoleamine 2,3-dioxygenase, partial [Lecanoromycetidae sp. Uapishka_2]